MHNHKIINLQDLKISEKAQLVECNDNWNNPLCQKLFALGIIPNSILQITRISPFQEYLYLTSDTNIRVAIRKTDSHNIKVIKLP